MKLVNYQAIIIELSHDGYRGDLMNEVSKFRYNLIYFHHEGSYY